MDAYERRAREVQELMQRFDAGDFDFTNSFFSTDMDASELVRRYAAGERNFSDIGLTSLDLSNINLAAANLTPMAFRPTPQD
ncbi:MAG: hypothetical protein HWQ41_21730 [Nostoc sp. NOS(2021)]|uniref:hypothetical protein n=1 Tax=Nostoc sp. NOS(2021) TaxID=2815407 RepID=UPI0025CBFD57|nr:hypothetical protein [Nostoc sp. NOS(2021)]MBN3897788.1 hypothetical protein [Nostoc sp. NOS(2021)]